MVQPSEPILAIEPPSPLPRRRRSQPPTRQGFSASIIVPRSTTHRRAQATYTQPRITCKGSGRVLRDGQWPPWPPPCAATTLLQSSVYSTVATRMAAHGIDREKNSEGRQTHRERKNNHGKRGEGERQQGNLGIAAPLCRHCAYAHCRTQQCVATLEPQWKGTLRGEKERAKRGEGDRRAATKLPPMSYCARQPWSCCARLLQ
jgi:hypothetical protein